jgi:agmatinase
MIFFFEPGKIALHSKKEPDWILFGIPYDSTCSFNTGARFGPDSIRQASYHLEKFDCELEVDLRDIHVKDVGNITVRYGDPRANYEIIRKAVSDIDSPFVALGGEHTIAYPLVSLTAPDVFVSLDAHLDLRDEYLGEKLSHACTSRRVSEICDVHIYGYRECSKEEYVFMKKNNIFGLTPSDLRRSDPLYPEGKTVHLSIDMDVLDPCEAPHVSNPVPGGLSFDEVTKIIHHIIERNTIVSADICEVTSRYADRTAIVAAALLYKILALWRQK